MTPDELAAWAELPLFAGLDSVTLAAIADQGVRQPMTSGEALIREGVWCGKLFVILHGVVRVSVIAMRHDDRALESASQEVDLRRLVPGDCFGEMSLLTGDLPSATVQALTDGEVWTLSQPDFLRLTLAYPALARNVGIILSERLRQANRRQAATRETPVTVLISATPALPADLARALAPLAGGPVLLVDLTAPAGAVAFTDLLDGRQRPPEGQTALTIAGLDLEQPTAATRLEVDLPVAIRRLGASYRKVLIAVPPGHPALTSQLLSFADRVLVGGAVTQLATVQALLAELPPATGDTRAVVLTEAPAALRPTVAQLAALGEILGTPVWTALPSRPADQPPALDALARRLLGQRVGLILGAGGAKGYAHAGVVRALRQIGVPFDCVTGTSIGAVIAAFVAMEWPVEQIEVALRVASDMILQPTLPLYSISSNRGLMALFRSEIVYGRRLIENLPVPFACCAAELVGGVPIVLRRGLLWQAVLASAAIPGFYPPVRVGRHWLVDGAVVDPLPVGTAELLGAEITVAVDLAIPLAPWQEPDCGAPATPRPPTLPATIMRSRDLMIAEIRARTTSTPHVLIKPAITDLSMRDFSQGERFIAAGEAAVEAILPQIYARMPWLDPAKRAAE